MSETDPQHPSSSRTHSERSSRHRHHRHRHRSRAAESPAAPSAAEERTADDSSLSVAAMNELRAKLGLAPLHSPAPFPAEEAATDAVAVADAAEQMSPSPPPPLTESLGSSLAREEGFGDALRWVERSRTLQQQKQKQQRRRLREDGSSAASKAAAVGDAIAAAHRIAQAFDAQDAACGGDELSGVRVAHDAGAFAADSESVLTLRDASVIGDSAAEDVLECDSLVAAEAQQRRRRRPDKFDDWEFERQPDGSAVAERRRVLAKYDDDEEDGARKTGFVLGGATSAAAEVAEDADQADAIRKRLQQAAEAASVAPLDATAAPGVQAEFYTREELAAFRKRRPPKRGRRREAGDAVAEGAAPVKMEEDADEQQQQEAMEDEAIDQDAEHGSRKTRAEKQRQKHAAGTLRELEARQKSYEKALRRARDASRMLLTQESEQQAPAELEEEEEELYRSLAKTRAAAAAAKERAQAKLSAEEFAAQAVLRARVKQEPSESAQHEGEGEDAGLVVSSMSEFVRGIQHITTKEEEDEEEEKKPQMAAASPFALPTSGAVSEAEKPRKEEEEEDKRESRMEEEVKEEEGDSLLAEPLVADGVAATLERLRNIGGLSTMEESARVLVGRRKDGEFVMHDPNDPAPHIKLEYLDSEGRQLRPKEAFRQQSYIFHGRMPGKRKLAKLQRRIEEDKRRRDMQSTDTPLHSVAALSSVQARVNAPYLVLTGQAMKDQLLAAADLKRRQGASKKAAPEGAPAAKRPKP